MTTETKPKLSLHKKLAQVMYEADTIPKNGIAPQAMGGFRFVQVGDAADVIRKALAEKSVSMIPSAIELIGESEHATSSGKMMTTMTVRTTWTLTDGDSGETAQIQSMGSGADMGDKAAPKAQSNAMKYALLMGFLLSTGDDPERADSSDRQAPQNGTTPNPPDVETEELVGDFAATGMVRNGSANGYKLEPRQGPAGHVIGFRMEFKDEKTIPQVVVEGPAGEALYIATSMNPAALLDTRLHVKGRLFNVKRPGRQSYKRLRVSEWSNHDYEFPAKDGPEPTEAETAPLFDDAEQAAIDAALDKVPAA